MFHVRLHMSMRWMYSVTNKNSVGRQYCFDAYTYATKKNQAASCSSARNSPSTWTNIPKIGYHSSFPGYTPSKQGTYIILDHMTSRDLFTNILPSNFFAILFLEQFQCPSNAIYERFTAGTVHGNTHKCQTQMLGLPLHNVNPQLWKLDLHHFGWCDGHWNDQHKNTQYIPVMTSRYGAKCMVHLLIPSHFEMMF